MKDFLEYILGEIKSERLPKTDAIDLIRQFHTKIVSDKSYFLHPLLQQNTSDLSEQRYSSNFTGQEFFLKDHVVRGQRILPGVACLEMARAAVAQAAEPLKENQTRVCLKNVIWARPIAVADQPVQVHIGLFPEDSGEVAYEIYSRSEDADAETVVYSQGSAVTSAVDEVPALDLQALQAQCSRKILSSVQCYEAFKTMAMDYGPAYQGIEKVYVGYDQVLAKLSLPSSVSGTQDRFILHPSLMDSALQASIGLMMDISNTGGIAPRKPALPFALQELTVLNKCTPVMWALVRYSEGSQTGDKVRKLDIDLCDEQGNVCVKMKGFSVRVPADEMDAVGVPAALETLLLTPCWQERAIPQEATAPDYYRQLVMLCEQGGISRESIESRMNGVLCLNLQSEEKGLAERFRAYAIQAFEEIQSILKGKPKGKVLIQVVVSAQDKQQLFAGLSGLLQTAQLENPLLIGQLIEVEAGEDTEEIIENLKDNSRNSLDNRIRYQDGKRYVAGWSEVETVGEAMKIPWKERGVYLITGGAGGLGLIFSKEIAHKVKDATLILTGRSPLREDKQEQLKELAAMGPRIEYRQMDVTQKEAVTDLIQNIREEFGSLHGIIHAAGVIKDNFLIKKTKEEWEKVLAPKVTGMINLDQASKDIPLDFFILFSSFAGAMGNVGQADYATANAFMDAYAKYRNTLAAANQRQGQTLSINWPLWQEGGMHIDQETERTIMQNKGIIAMRTKTGIYALYQSLASGQDQVMVVEGDRQRLQAALLGQAAGIEAVKALSSSEENKTVSAIGEDILREKATHYLKMLLSSVIKLPVQRIEADTPMEKYGIDSVMVMQLTDQLEKTFGSLPKTLFFEYQTIQELTGYFVERYQDQLIALLGIKQEKAAATAKISEDLSVVAGSYKSNVKSRRRSRFASLRIGPQEEKTALDIAIIGVSGRYPGAMNIREFWKNLRDGKDSITEIPQDRWDHSLYFDEDKNKPGKTYSKWGGFLDDIDKFDPLLFNIAPRDAQGIDPQERIFLETVWETMEDAGYTRTRMGRSAKVGVFVGVMWGEYQLLGDGIRENFVPPAQSFASIANRVSYFYNFHGPSIALDTMCSSSLTAIYLACNSICRGDCEMAMAGGVNLSLHPNKYVQLSLNRFLSGDGRCRSFGEGGDGYVPGEGVGAVLLKPLAKAIVDQDQIYAVIKNISVNHGGKTNGYTVPNLNAQADLIAECLEKAKIDSGTVTYIETHGTGTALGDPIEINGLTKAYSKYTQDKQYCAVGSVKSNIGHLEPAAGIAGLTKILLQLKHKQIAPSLHAGKLNPNIDFVNTPFYVQQELAEWSPLEKIENGIARKLPLRAAMSSFGAGGANAHMILEEYKSVIKADKLQHTFSQIMVLSARTKDCLYEYARRILNFCNSSSVIGEEGKEKLDFADMAYTLQIGREAMDERMAIIGKNLADFIDGLTKFLNSPKTSSDQDTIFYGCVTGAPSLLFKDQFGDEVLDRLLQQRDLRRLATLWVEGITVPWEKLHYGNAVRRISLPTYPFERKVYWIAGETKKDEKLKPDVMARSLNDEKSLPRVPVTEYAMEKKTTTSVREVQDLIRLVIAQNLGMELNDLNIEADFADYGLDSLSQMRIINDLQKKFGDIISLTDFFEQNTVKKLAEYIIGKIDRAGRVVDKTIMRNEEEEIGQNNEEKLNSITNQAAKFPDKTIALKTKNILLNGVTGVLGGRLIRDFLEMTDSMLYCLVRAKDLEQARHRIQTMLEVHDPDHSLLSEFDSRVIPVLGDITQSLLGMQPALYEELTRIIDMVVHSAGKTSLHGLYSEVKEVNVDGTKNMINFTLRTQQKYFIHVSTIAVMGDRQYKAGETFKEKDFDLGQKFENLGYAKSKFEAEQIVRSTQGLKWTIMRSGYIMGDSEKGYYPFNITGVPGIYYDFLKTVIDLEMVVDSSWYYDITPIDYVSRSMVWLATSLKDLYQTYHLSNPDYPTLKDIGTIISKLGYPLRFVSIEEYMNFLRSESNHYRSITTDLMLFNPAMRPAGGNSCADTTYTAEVLAQGGINCPKIDEKLIATYLDYCIKIGYLENSISPNTFWNWHITNYDFVEKIIGNNTTSPFSQYC
ncbi:MAG TPA: SDR family NAD(P)-dependent oxidoreductase [Methylomusa anaerophila]|uniref:Polyketide synthase PksL n=1 Tax=Methylomusa anaerophila TaxID=1930071 RepID=A0A348AQR6_9FIRM|nr:SDR family NAD(P)-dependent oxidoreductase [Methylomusa anaerophila]BBB93414.1 polyketide synthase PksL [Methylomusa anaerophila]HML90666.1 SDR family NAD(P)-dependent oxidoreductase [Methylomusa anaerophila]